MAVFFVEQYNSSLSSFVPNFRILTQVVAEKSLTENSLQTDKQAYKYNYRKGKNLYSPYTAYRVYKYNVNLKTVLQQGIHVSEPVFRGDLVNEPKRFVG